LRKKIASRGSNGIYSLGRLFRNIDDDRSRWLSMEEFGKCMREFRLGMSVEDVEIVYNVFDSDNNDRLSYDEFLRGVRGVMN
jgi:Ca2+-binding EF-hand superfamily protein